MKLRLQHPAERKKQKQKDSEFNDIIQVNFVNLNTQEIESTQEVDLTITGFIGLDEINGSNYLASPNPANAEVKLPFSGRWLVLDLSGRQVTQLTSNDDVYDVSALEVGTYILRNLEQPNRSVKVTIQR